jgi:hypothetical protein
MKTVMISCAQRALERAKTLTQFEAIGIIPEVFLSDCAPACGDENRRITLKALTSCYDDGHHCLFIEDDIDINPDLPEAIRLAREINHFTTFCLLRDTYYPNLIRQRLVSRTAIPFGLYDVHGLDRWYGTQCVYIPYRLVTYTVEHPDFLNGGNTGFDFFIRQHYPFIEGERFLSVVPNPVQHRSPESMAYLTGGTDKRRAFRQSKTYHPEGYRAFNAGRMRRD